MSDSLPRWDLNTVYPGLDSEAYRNDKEELTGLSARLSEHLRDGELRKNRPAEWLTRSLEMLNRLEDLSQNLGEYVYAVWSTDTRDEEAQREVDDLEARSLRLKDALTRFRSLLPRLDKDRDDWAESPEIKPYAFWLEEQRLLADRQMDPELEALAADLQRSGGDAWGRLQGKVSSELTRRWKEGTKTVTELRDLAFHPDRDVRKKAWEEEIAAWESMETPLAAALNGVKGASQVLNDRRGWGSTLARSLRQSRISRTTLDAMLGTMTESLGTFRRYFRAKARLLGVEKLAFYDLFAPLGSAGAGWTWKKARRLITEQFENLEPAYADFARDAFEKNWFDAEPRTGKTGGAYCVTFPLAGESRIFCNFNGSMDSVSTVAHELGHAWHGHVMKDLPALQRDYPMTLAETASIFSETLVFEAAVSHAGAGDRAAVLDTWLMGSSQVVVDILSRFLFESDLMRRRADGEVPPRELKEMMLEAQERTYGDALDPAARHPFMWAVKGHYYDTDLAFYNFPYAFGLLFGLGLFGIFREEGAAFAGRYREILRLSGSRDAVSVGRSAGFDIENPDFWRKGLAFVADRVADLESIAR